MKTVVLWSLVVLLLAIAASTKVKKGVTVNYDRVRDLSSVSSGAFETARGRHRLIFMFDCPGHVERCDPKTVAVVIGIHTPLSDTSAFHTGVSMTLLLDGTARVQPGKLTYVNLQADDSGTFVYFGADFTPEDFKSLARAKTIEGAVSTVDFSIKPEDINLLAEMATHINEGEDAGMGGSGHTPTH